MDGEIDCVVQQCFLNLLGEEPLAPDLGKRPVLQAIAGRPDDYEVDRSRRGELGMRRSEPLADNSSLDEGHRAAACADPKESRTCHDGRSCTARY